MAYDLVMEVPRGVVYAGAGLALLTAEAVLQEMPPQTTRCTEVPISAATSLELALTLGVVAHGLRIGADRQWLPEPRVLRSVGLKKFPPPAVIPRPEPRMYHPREGKIDFKRSDPRRSTFWPNGDSN